MNLLLDWYIAFAIMLIGLYFVGRAFQKLNATTPERVLNGRYIFWWTVIGFLIGGGILVPLKIWGGGSDIYDGAHAMLVSLLGMGIGHMHGGVVVLLHRIKRNRTERKE